MNTRLSKASLLASVLLAPASFAAGIEELSKPAVAPIPQKAETPAPAEDDTEESDTEKPADAAAKPATKQVVKSAASKSLENRLSLGTSLGWGIVKPAKGTWNGLGTSDLSLRWRTSRKEGGKLFITGRYAPFAGVWTVDKRDYDTTLHGIYGGAEFQSPVGNATLKAGVELGYMMVYAKAQDKAEAASDVKGGKVNMTAGGGADWSILSNKVKIGPFARVHVAGFSIINVGGSAQFVF